MIRHLLLLIIALSIVGCKTRLKDPGPNPSLEKYLGEFSWIAKDPDANSQKIDLSVGYTRNNMVEISITGFPGPFFGNKGFDANNLKLLFNDVAAISEHQLTFVRQAEGRIDGKVQYKASFDVKIEPSPTGVLMTLSMVRIDAPGSILLYHYPMTKK
nr:hypothetical protein [uncultured Dyadobacter sp.]